MPPKAKYTRDEIVRIALDLVAEHKVSPHSTPGVWAQR